MWSDYMSDSDVDGDVDGDAVAATTNVQDEWGRNRDPHRQYDKARETRYDKNVYDGAGFSWQTNHRTFHDLLINPMYGNYQVTDH